MSTLQPVSAAQAVGEFLQSPDDLAKITAFRKKLEKEKASIDARLKTGVKEQLDATREGLRKLFTTRKNVQAIKDEMQSIDKESSDPQNYVATFDQISRVSMVHRNFELTEEMVNNLLEMSSKLDMLEDMLEEDASDILGPAPNLLTIHYHLTRLEAFRNETMHQAKKASSKSRTALNHMFERLTNFIEAFEQYIIGLAKNILNLVRAGHPEVVVKLIKIAEVEGKEDEKAIMIRLVKKAAKMDAASRFKSMQANARIIKHYRSKINKAIQESIKDKFDDIYNEYAPDLVGFLEGLQWIYQDIIRIQEDVVPCFPPDYDIYSLFVKEYHKVLNATIKRMLESEPEAAVILVLNSWLKEYKKSMKELEVPPELLEPPLLDGKDQSLIDDYVKLIIKKLDEWTNNLMVTETADFVTRAEPPELDADGQYGLQRTSILLKIYDDHVDSAMKTGQGAILARIVSEINRVMRGVQETWTKTIEAELKKQQSEKQTEEIPGGLVEYTIAVCNDQIRSADYAEALLARLEPVVSEKYRVTINERLNDAIDGYLDVAKRCIQVLIDLIFNDLKTVTKQLFQPQWYDGVMDFIVATVKDYMTDYQTYLHSSLLDLLVEDLLDNFLLVYLNALASAPKLRIPAAIERIKDDMDAIFRFFATLKKQDELEKSFEVIDLILGMLEASKEMVFLSYWSFARVHGPNIAFVESLMKCRGDLDRSGVNEVMEAVKRKVKDEELTDPEEPTIMKKVAVQGVISRFLNQARS